MWQRRARSARAGELPLQEARAIVLGGLPAPRTAAFQLDAALGRVLGEDVRAGEQLPRFDSSAMDGFAIRALDAAGARQDRPVQLRIVGESSAGHPAQIPVRPGEAIAISTGAPMPAGTDAVLRVELTASRDGLVRVSKPVDAHADVRTAGEDVRAGELVLSSGTRLGPAQIGMLAALGREQVLCARAPRVSLILSGDELLLGQSRPRAAGAVADSNSHSIGAAIRCCGAVPERIVIAPDEQAAIAEAITAALDSDLLILCGGMSVGAHDHVRPVLYELGARQAFWGLALKPGHPTWFGHLHAMPVFGLPGNPVSAMVTFTLLVAPLLEALQGARPKGRRATAALQGGYRKPAGRTHAIRCRLAAGAHGWSAEATGPQGSHIHSSMLEADALAIVPSEATEIRPGGRVVIEPLVPWSHGALP